jgi:hypothetical protein
MHADFQELLAVRDGVPIDPAVEDHIASCSQCSFELTRLARVKLDLRQLPSFEPPPQAWRAVRGRLEGAPRRRTLTRPLLALATASGALAALALAWFVYLPPGGATRTRPPAYLSARQPPASRQSDAIGTLISRSQRLEAILDTLPPRPNVERAATSATIDDLQTRIQLVDAQLSDPAKSTIDRDQAQRLWSARVQLLDSLVHMRYAEAASVGDWTHSSNFGVI